MFAESGPSRHLPFDDVQDLLSKLLRIKCPPEGAGIKVHWPKSIVTCNNCRPCTAIAAAFSHYVRVAMSTSTLRPGKARTTTKVEPFLLRFSAAHAMGTGQPHPIH